MRGEDLQSLVIIIPLLVGGLLGLLAANVFSRANAEILHSLRMPDDLVRIACNSLMIRVVGSLAFLAGLCLLLFRMIGD
jgi:hypothetical protein